MLSGLENPVHWAVILGIALLLFGPKRLPELGRSLGAGIRGFRESLSIEPEPEADESSTRQPPGSAP